MRFGLQSVKRPKVRAPLRYIDAGFARG